MNGAQPNPAGLYYLGVQPLSWCVWILSFEYPQMPLLVGRGLLLLPGQALELVTDQVF
jgi:hypothetical protein